MNRYRMRYPDHQKVATKPAQTDDGGASPELSKAAETVYDTAAEHRERVKARDAAAKARKKKTRG
jgi:hypothetical protein